MPDIENITLKEYLEYNAEKELRLRRNVQSKRNPTKYEGADFNSFHQDRNKAFDYMYYHENFEINKYYQLPLLLPCFQPDQPYTKAGLVSFNKNDEIFGDLFRMGAKNFSGMKQEEAKVEDCDEGNMDDIWDITVEDVPGVMDDMIQPLIPQTIHTTPRDKDYVASTTKLILEEFRYEILNITVIDEEVDFNHTRDIEELESLIEIDHESSFTEIRVLSCIANANVKHETFIRQMNLLHRLSQSAKSSTKTARLVGCLTDDDDDDDELFMIVDVTQGSSLGG
ncbi:hypothetical protein Tco_0499374, partial [Tanacetum coccineum]